mmetsp:Transcript_7670/g.21275  ORF Transcript_7670/g.21275 Transcript_7670/m.21275 type:complete len:255 (+) Transcript_7670:147-911(+)
MSVCCSRVRVCKAGTTRFTSILAANKPELFSQLIIFIVLFESSGLSVSFAAACAFGTRSLRASLRIQLQGFDVSEAWCASFWRRPNASSSGTSRSRSLTPAGFRGSISTPLRQIFAIRLPTLPTCLLQTFVSQRWGSSIFLQRASSASMAFRALASPSRSKYTSKVESPVGFCSLPLACSSRRDSKAEGFFCWLCPAAVIPCGPGDSSSPLPAVVSALAAAPPFSATAPASSAFHMAAAATFTQRFGSSTLAAS